jgi:hypothetical protein
MTESYFSILKRLQQAVRKNNLELTLIRADSLSAPVDSTGLLCLNQFNSLIPVGRFMNAIMSSTISFFLPQAAADVGTTRSPYD